MHRTVLALGLASVLPLVSGTAHAQAGAAPTAVETRPSPASKSEDEAHPQLGFRSFGWSLPIGKTDQQGGKISALVAGTFPTILDLGMRWNRWLFVGLYLGFNYGVPSQDIADSCAEAVRCSVSSFRVGGQVQLFPWRTRKGRPWLGIGAGYESLGVLVDIPTPAGADSRGIALTLRGLELPSLLGGVDYHVNDTFAFGPFLGLSAGTYHSAALDTVNGLYRIERLEPSLHAWATAGVRLSLFP